MPELIGSGWEWGWIDLVSANNNEGTHDGSPTIVSGAWANSLYALRISTSGTTTQDYNFGGGLGPLGNFIATTAIPQSYFRLDWKCDTAPGVNYESIFRLDNTAASHAKFTLAINSSRQLVALDRNLTVMATGTTVLPLSTKTTLYVSVGTGATAPWEVRINSSTATPEISGTGNLDTVGGGEIRIGRTSGQFSNTIDFGYDNFSWRDDFYPPPGVMILLAPIADGFYTNGVANGQAQKWQCLAEVPSDGDTSYVNGLTIGQAYTARVAQLPTGIVNYVLPLYSAKRDGGVSTATGLRLRVGSSDFDTATFQATLGPNYNVFRRLFETNPVTGLPWVQTDVNALQVGVIQTDANPARVSSAYVMVEYQPMTPTLFLASKWASGASPVLGWAKGAALASQWTPGASPTLPWSA